MQQLTNLSQFHEKVTNNTSDTVLVKIETKTCAPCKALVKPLEELEQTYSGQMKFYKVDAEEATDIVSYLGVSSVPNILFYQEGEFVDGLVGFQSKQQLEAAIKRLA